MATKKPLRPDELRAAKLSRIPGVTIAEAAARFCVPLAGVRRARAEVPALSRAELALAALSDNGLKQSFSIKDLSFVASYLDYINHDACDVDDVRALLDVLARDGLIALEGDRARLLKPWP